MDPNLNAYGNMSVWNLGWLEQTQVKLTGKWLSFWRPTFIYTGWFKKMDSIEEYTAPQHTPDSWLRCSKFSARSKGWLAWATLKTLLNSSHVLLWYTWSAGAFAFTQTAYLLKLVIPTTNFLSRWRLNVETKTKRTLHSSRRLSFNEPKNAKFLCCIVAILLSTDTAAWLCDERVL